MFYGHRKGPWAIFLDGKLKVGFGPQGHLREHTYDDLAWLGLRPVMVLHEIRRWLTKQSDKRRLSSSMV